MTWQRYRSDALDLNQDDIPRVKKILEWLQRGESIVILIRAKHHKTKESEWYDEWQLTPGEWYK